MSLQSSKFSLAAAALGLAYFAITYVVFNQLPYVDLPAGWASLWPSPRLGLVVWFQLVTLGGAIVCAAPIALVVMRYASDLGPWLAWVIATPTAVWALAGATEYLGVGTDWLSWVNTAGTFVYLLLAMPVSVLGFRRVLALR